MSEFLFRFWIDVLRALVVIDGVGLDDEGKGREDSKTFIVERGGDVVQLGEWSVHCLESTLCDTSSDCERKNK